jgi:cytochrome c biogenesis protein CcdA
VNRGPVAIATPIVAAWVLVHLLYLGAVQDSGEASVLWALAITTAAVMLAAIVMLVVAMTLGQTRPAWLRFVRAVRNVAAIIGSALIIVGLLHYRETQRGEIHWVVFGLAVLVGAGVVHWWLTRAVRRQTS